MTAQILAAIRSLEQLPQLEPIGFYMHRLFPADRAWQFRSADGELMTCAHPAFWDRVPLAPAPVSPAQTLPKLGALWPPIGSVEVIDLNDKKHAADLQRVFRAFAEALGLPADLCPF